MANRVSQWFRKLSGHHAHHHHRKMTREDFQKLPRHVAIIMDGNGRWAKQHRLNVAMWHRQGTETLREIIRHTDDLKIEALSIYAFSTENWKRSEEEISAIMRLLGDYLKEALADMDKNRVRFVFFGDLTRLSPELQTLCQQAADRSRQYDGVQVNFCLNYGGRDEILRAARRFAQACLDGKAKPEDLTAAQFSSLLYSAGVPDPELVIRPSGELRTSNFLLWQTAYSEYVFLDKLWPDFTAEDLDAAIDAYRHRSRRFGGAKP